MLGGNIVKIRTLENIATAPSEDRPANITSVHVIAPAYEIHMWRGKNGEGALPHDFAICRPNMDVA